MIGNDVIDLNDPDALAGPGFIRRAFSDREQQCLGVSAGRASIWTRWAAKEAAFKAASRMNPALPFDWPRYVTSPDLRIVTSPAGVFECRVRISDSWVHAVCLRAGASWDHVFEWMEPVAGVSSSEDHGDVRNPSELVRRQVLTGCRQLLNGKNLDVRMGTRGRSHPRRPPTILVGNAERPVSYSHHGAYVASCAYLPEAVTLPSSELSSGTGVFREKS